MPNVTPMLMTGAGGMDADRWRRVFAKVFSSMNSGRAQLRDTLAYAIAHPGEGTPDDPHARNIHEGWMRTTSRGMADHLRPAVVRAILDGLGRGNEVVSGSLNYLAGGGFYGPKGYDQEDIEANRRGISAGLADAERGPSLEDLKLVPVRR